jgi:glycine/D-amino acid oxidase-like deaminating enzyme/Rieske Fe-S protein
MANRTESIWRGTHAIHPTAGAPLPANLQADVAVVGGGITGLTAAVILAQAGSRVVLLERDRIGSGETGNTTSHLTEAVDARYRNLITDFGEEQAALVARSSRDAIDWIEKMATGGAARCGFERVPGYLYTERKSDIEDLANELDAARRAGCAVEWVDRVPLPFLTHGAIRWPHQGQVHATAYLDRLLQVAMAAGVQVFEQTPVVGVHEDEPCRVETEQGTVRARQVFVAANVPINNRVLLHTKIAAYRSYAIATEVPAGFVSGLFWDTDAPYHYTRCDSIGGRTFLIVGGEDHRTGVKTETGQCFDAIEKYMRQRFGVGARAYQWSGQIIEPVDGLPYIGRNSASEHVFVATGYSGNGMTFGTLAGMIASDLMLGRPNPYASLFDATRVNPAAVVDYVKENALFPAKLMTDRLTSLDVSDKAVQQLKPGEGGIFNSDEGKIAVCRTREGAVHAVSAVCTHLGCDVAWNQSEQSWDCPCHGSRFTPAGDVVNGPAVMGLRRVPAKAAR